MKVTVSYGTFLHMCPFYFHSVTTCDVELCCCKLHVHGCCSVAVLLGIIKKMAYIVLNSNNYYSFFKFLAADSPKDNYAHISCQCTPDKTSPSSEILNHWKRLEKFSRQSFTLFDASDKNHVTVKIDLFQSVRVKTRFNEVKRKLKCTSTSANICFIINFMKDLMPEIIYPQNEL